MIRGYYSTNVSIFTAVFFHLWCILENAAMYCHLALQLTAFILRYFAKLLVNDKERSASISAFLRFSHS